MARIEKVAVSFRLSKDCGIRVDKPISQICRKIADEINDKTPSVKDHSIAAKLVTYTPDDEEMTGWCRQHVYARVQNSNCHHVKIQGQWNIKEGLTKIAAATSTTLEAILELKTPAEVTELIKKYDGTALEEKVDTL
jgi:hypothetical protein